MLASTLGDGDGDGGDVKDDGAGSMSSSTSTTTSILTFYAMDVAVWGGVGWRMLLEQESLTEEEDVLHII